MTVTVNLTKAKATLSALVDRAAAGEEIVLAKAGRPVARIVPLPLTEQGPRRPGVAAHWLIDDAALLAPTEPDDLDAADGQAAMTFLPNSRSLV